MKIFYIVFAFILFTAASVSILIFEDYSSCILFSIMALHFSNEYNHAKLIDKLENKEQLTP